MLPESNIEKLNEVESICSAFDKLDGRCKLEVIKYIMERLESGQIEYKEETIYPVNIEIEDGYACCRAIARILK